jgi:8-oxo-dGTP pyrophosphatase MutT (NUDIX family)
MAPPTGLKAMRDELAQVLLAPADAVAISVHGRTEAAVLVPLYLDENEINVVFTRRHEELPRHGGEISFPGGRREEGESDLRTTALREAQEEIGLPPEAVDIVGALQPTPTLATGYAVFPFVGLIDPGRAWVPSTTVVTAVIVLSVALLVAG